MNTDLALIGMLVAGALLGFLLGYSKGHEHGMIRGRILRGRELRDQVRA